MVAGADSIDDMALLRHGGMGRVFARAYAPSTLGSFLRAFTFGHVRQLHGVAARFLLALARLAGLVSPLPDAASVCPPRVDWPPFPDMALCAGPVGPVPACDRTSVRALFSPIRERR
jgi:hypothetical protein